MRALQANPAILLFLSACFTVPAFGQTVEPASLVSVPIAIVPAGGSATVTGALQVTAGKALIATSGSISSGDENTDVTLPRRGMLKVCASTTVKLTSDTTVPAGETPGLMLALDRGAVEASFATGRSSDILLTPDFRILIAGPGASQLKVRLGQHGDTCVDNPGGNAPYVIVSSVFEGGAYRVQPGQRVMFQHGSLHEVVDNEKEPCGCPPDAPPASNDFPLAQSAGLAAVSPPVINPPASAPAAASPVDAPLAYNAPKPPEGSANTQTATGPQYASDSKFAQPTSSASPAKKKGLFGKIGGFFRKIFGGE
jgi:hypothetical protein